MSLYEGYELVDKAEQLVSKRQFKEASTFYKQASIKFGENVGKTQSKEINEALTLLKEQYGKRSNEMKTLATSNVLKTGRNSTTPRTSGTNTPSLLKKMSDNSLSSSLASARGIPSMEPLSLNVDGDMDPVTRFQIQVYNLIKTPKLQTDDIDTQATSQENIPPSGKSIEELELENHTLKQLLGKYSENLQVYESYNKKIKANIKNCLGHLKKELQAQDRKRKVEYEAKIESLNKDNEKLSSQIQKLKQRWDELVQSAKKRRSSTANEEREESTS